MVLWFYDRKLPVFGNLKNMSSLRFRNLHCYKTKTQHPVDK